MLSKGGLGFETRIGKSDTVSLTVRHAATFFRSRVAQALSRKDKLRLSLHASAYFHKYMKDLILTLCIDVEASYQLFLVSV